MAYCVGLTGGIASGKSTVAELFSELGMHVINADKISKELTAKNQTAYHEIVAHFGTGVLDTEGELNRKKLRDIIFTDPGERTWLEQLLHPPIRNTIKNAVDSCQTPYCIVEIPLLVDKKNYPYINKILLVTAKLQTQIKRLMQRDNCTKAQALAIVEAQPDMDLRIQNADDLIANDQGINELKASVKSLHHHYLTLI